MRGSLGAWPLTARDAAVGGPLTDLQVPRAWGPAQERPDGTIAPNAVAVVVFDEAGARIER